MRKVSLHLVQHVLRARICPLCEHRPPGSEVWGADFPRNCEPRCSIFLNLPRLKEAADRLAQNGNSVDAHLLKLIHALHPNRCCSAKFAAKHEPDGELHNDPLHQHAERVAQVMGRLMKK